MSNKRVKKQIKWIFITGCIMGLGLLLFKYLPMKIYGNNILFDASAHIVFACFILYILWFFVDQNKNLRIIYLIFSFAVIIAIIVQRIVVQKHDEFGIIIGLIISALGIAIPRIKELKRAINF